MTTLQKITPGPDTYVLSDRDGERATVVVRSWEHPQQASAAKKEFGGELLIHSSFGTWAHTWQRLAMPFKEFLASRGYYGLFDTLTDHASDVFDGPASFARLISDVSGWLASGRLSLDEHTKVERALLNRKDRLTASEDQWCDTLEQLGNANVAGLSERALQLLSTTDPANRILERQEPGAAGFWATMWPQLLAQWATEQQEAAAPPVERGKRQEFHCVMTCDALLREPPDVVATMLRHKDGTPIGAAEAYALATTLKAKGMKALPACDNHDAEGFCLGHDIDDDQGDDNTVPRDRP